MLYLSRQEGIPNSRSFIFKRLRGGVGVGPGVKAFQSFDKRHLPYADDATVALGYVTVNNCGKPVQYLQPVAPEIK